MDVPHSEPLTDTTAAYATDFSAWCLSTAALVRTGQWAAIDPEALAEELESLGNSQKRELESRLITLVTHLLKWDSQPLLRQDSQRWLDTIVTQRQELELLLRDNPSLRLQVPTLLAAASPKACQRAHRDAACTVPASPALPGTEAREAAQHGVSPHLPLDQRRGAGCGFLARHATAPPG